MLLVAPGYTYSLFFSFWDTSGARTSVDSPIVDIYTPERNPYVDGEALTTTSTTGKYQYNFFAPVGITVGHWYAVGVGLSNNNTLFSEVTPFEVTDPKTDAQWVGFEEFREYLGLADDERSEDTVLRQLLQAAIELVEGYTNRHYGVYQYDEIIEIKCTDRVKLKHFPVYTLVAITPTVKVIPRDVNNLLTETVTDSQVSFYYRLDSANGIIHLTDSAGFDEPYDGILLGISYLAGFATVPEPVRQAVLGLGASLRSIANTEGITSVRMGSVAFAMQRGLFDGKIGVSLYPYRNNYQV